MSQGKIYKKRLEGKITPTGELTKIYEVLERATQAARAVSEEEREATWQNAILEGLSKLFEETNQARV